METLSIKLNNGNAKTIVTYDEQKSNVFWAEQSTNSYHGKSEEFISEGNASSSFDKKLKAIMKVPKPSSK